MPDPVGDLRSSIDAAHAAAERLVQEATDRARRAESSSREQNRGVPPRGWEVPRSDEENAGVTPDLAAIIGLLESVKDIVPAELSVALAEAMRELLLALRALIDWYIDRLEGLATPAPARDKQVEDIPIS